MQRCFAGVTSVKMSALETQMIAAKQQNKKEKENVLMLFFELQRFCIVWHGDYKALCKVCWCDINIFYIKPAEVPATTVLLH